VLNILYFFAKISVVRINLDKTQLIWIGEKNTVKKNYVRIGN